MQHHLLSNTLEELLSLAVAESKAALKGVEFHNGRVEAECSCPIDHTSLTMGFMILHALANNQVLMLRLEIERRAASASDFVPPEMN
jgi:hypothetical protein